MRAATIRWAAVVCVTVCALPACDEGTPSNASPTVTVSRTPDGQAIAGVTEVVFNATASADSGGSLTVTWDFGDGQRATGASAVHVYPREGVFAVSVTVSDSGGGVTTTGTSVTVGGLNGRWLLSEGGARFYERGFDMTQAGPALGGRPFSIPDQGCLGDIHGRVTSPRTLRFEFVACDGNVVVIDGTAGNDLRAIPGTYTHPDGPPQPIVLARN